MAFGYAFYSAATDQADSKTRAFLGWQGIAGIAAVALYGVGLAWEKGSAARNLSRWPLILAVLVALGTGGVFFVSGSL